MEKPRNNSKSHLLGGLEELLVIAGAVLVEGGKIGGAREVTPLCNLISFRSTWALSLGITLPSSGQEGLWAHYFYQNGMWSSPRRHHFREASSSPSMGKPK